MGKELDRCCQPGYYCEKCSVTRFSEIVSFQGNKFEMTIPAAAKNDSDKIDLSLIPAVSEEAEAEAFMIGEKKYGRYNYEKGHKASKLIAALRRHANAWFNGEDRDPKDGQLHLGSVKACASMLLRQIELGTLIDDRSPSKRNISKK